MDNNKKISREFKVGVFGVVIIVALYLGINYIQNNRIFSSDKVLYGVFSSSDGLEASAPVISKGFRVGTVENVDMNMKTGKIIVTFSVRKEYPLTVDSKIKIASASLLGGKVVEVIYGSADEYVSNKDTIPVIEEQSLSEFVNSEYVVLKEKLTEYSIHIDSILSGLDKVLSKENAENISATIKSISKLSADLSSLLEKKHNNISNIIANLDTLSANLAAASPNLKDAIGKINEASDSIPSLMKDARDAVGSLNSILKKVDQEDGNLGKLINDDELYNSITKTVQSLDTLLTDLKAHPKRYINVTVFGRKNNSDKE